MGGLKPTATQITHKKITLSDIIADNDFWLNHFKDTSQLPNILHKPETEEEALNSRFQYNPFDEIVGHEEEKDVAIKRVYWVLSQFRKMHLAREKLESEGKKEDYPFGDSIIDILAREFPAMPMIVRSGPYGGTKTLQQKAEKELFYMLRDSFGITGRDYYTKYDKDSSLEFLLVDKSSPNGKEDIDKFEREQAQMRKLKHYGIKGALYTTGAFIGVALANIIISNYYLAEYFGVDSLTWVTEGVVSELIYLAYASVIGMAATLGYFVKRFFSKNKNNDLKRLSLGSDMPRTYKGAESLESLIGSYDKDAKDISPQFKLRSVGDLLTANEGVFVVENLNALSKEVQHALAQQIEEKYVDLANLKIRKFCYVYHSFGLNTEKTSELEESLRNRLNYAVNLYVKNEIKRNTYNERHMALYLRFKSSQGGNIPWKSDAWKELLDYCSRLAGNAGELRIDRGVISVIERAQTVAKERGSDSVGLQHLLDVERDYLSFVQTPLTERLRDFSLEHAFKPGEGSEVGVVHALISYHDTVLNDSSAGKARFDKNHNEDYSAYIRSEDYVGYAMRTTALAKRVADGEKGKISITASDGSGIDEARYVKLLAPLFWHTDLSRYNIHIAVESPADDDTVLSSMYVAVRSAIENKPIRQDRYIALKLIETGRLGSVPRLNSRMGAIPGVGGQKIVVSDTDYNRKILTANGRSIYRENNAVSVSNLDVLMSVMQA
ncbi:hypothetical protein M1316_02960 [Candidatus Parvarchaeota archaeon]|nr:hypothetical protein [Candidatus Parvarchaeota archaeon]